MKQTKRKSKAPRGKPAKSKSKGEAPPRVRSTAPIHARITQLRKRAKLSQGEFAAALGLHVTATNHWEQGFARPKLSRLAEVARVLGVTVDALIAGERAA